MESLSYPPSKSDLDDCSNTDGLRDDELEEFLHARSATICLEYFNFRNCQIIDYVVNSQFRSLIKTIGYSSVLNLCRAYGTDFLQLCSGQSEEEVM